MDDHGPGFWVLHLFGVDLREEAEHPTGLLGHAVIGPAQVLVLPDGPRLLRLDRVEDASEHLLLQKLIIGPVCDGLVQRSQGQAMIRLQG